MLTACGQNDDTEELDDAEEQVAESESAEEDEFAEAATEESRKDSTEEMESEDDGSETEGADEIEENVEADEPIEITTETVLAEEEGTDVEDGASVLEEVLTEYIEETGIENLTSESMYDKAMEVVGGHPDTIEAIEFFNSYDPELDVTLSHMLDGLEVYEDTVLLNNNIYILLDNSSSMLEEVNGETKMEVARTAVDNFASEFPEGVEVS